MVRWFSLAECSSPGDLVREGVANWIGVLQGDLVEAPQGWRVEDFGQRMAEMMDHTI